MSDEYQSIKVADARAAVQASGELEGIEGPHYSVGDPAAFGTFLWAPAFRATEAHPHPDFARVIITRKGQKPREVVISWDEYAEQMDDPEWDALRAQKPMSIFGAEVERHAYRVVFADVLAKAFPPRIISDQRYAEAEPRLVTVAADWELNPPKPPRDWFAEVKVADAATLNALYDEARDAGALVKVDGLQKAFTDRLIELSSAPKPKPSPRPQGDRPRRRRSKRPAGSQ